MSADDFSELGAYKAGEIPEPWRYTFADSDGNPIDISGYTVKLTYQLDGGTQVVQNAVLIDGPTGVVEYVWVAADTATAGVMDGEMWVGNGGTRRYAASFSMTIKPTRGGPAPNI